MDKEYEDDYPPFLLLKELFLKYLNEAGIRQTDEEQEIGLIKTWALVHGMASIACMNGVKTSMNWADPDIRLLIPG
jgi:hypothetical protein